MHAAGSCTQADAFSTERTGWLRCSSMRALHDILRGRATYYAVVSLKCCASSLHVSRYRHLADKLQKLISLLNISHLLSAHGFSVARERHDIPGCGLTLRVPGLMRL